MHSSELVKYGFKEWFKIKPRDYDGNKKLVLSLPRKKGVYIIRKSNGTIPRIKGESDIIYIGQGTIQSRIQALLRSHLPLNFRDYSNKHTAREAFERILSELNFETELSFVLTKDSEEAKDLESSLLRRFCEKHIEPPPLNNTRE